MRLGKSGGELLTQGGAVRMHNVSKESAYRCLLFLLPEQDLEILQGFTGVGGVWIPLMFCGRIQVNRSWLHPGNMDPTINL